MDIEQAKAAITAFTCGKGVYVLHHASNRPRDRWGTWFIWFYGNESKDYQGVLKMEQRQNEYLLIEGRIERMVE